MFSRPTALRAVRRALLASGFFLFTLLSACGGGGSASGGGTATASTPTPIISSISPNQATSGGPDLTLTVMGSNFTSSCYIEWDGTSLPTTFVSTSELQTTIPANIVASGQTLYVDVTTRSGETSNKVKFTIVQGPFELTSVSPDSAPLGGSSFTLTIRGDGFTSGDHVYWNNTDLAASIVSGAEIDATVPASLLTTPGSGAIVVTATSSHTNRLPVAVGYTAKLVQQQANDIVWDSTHNAVYVSIPANAGTNANSIAILDPVTGAITPVVQNLSDPNYLTLSHDHSYLYAGIDGDGTIQRFSLPGFTPDISINLNPISGTFFLTAGPMAVSPVNPHTVAVSLRLQDSSSAPTGAIYDDDVPRNTYIAGKGELHGNSFAWNADATELYTNTDGNYMGLSFATYSVSSSGLTQTGGYSDLFAGNGRAGANLHYEPDRQLIFTDNGYAADHSGNIIDDFRVPGGTYREAIIDSSGNRAFFVNNVYNFGDETTIYKFNLTTLAYMGSLVIVAPDAFVRPLHMVWINHDTIALTVEITDKTLQQNSHKEIYLITGPFAQP